MKVYYDESPAGSGKTERSISNITRSACKVIFVTERKSSFPELEARIGAVARQWGRRPIIRKIHSDLENGGRSVTKEVEELPSRYASLDHVIVLVTHAALLRSDFSGFSGWRIVVDEVPAFLDFEEKVTHLDAAYFKRHYALERIEGAWHAVTLTPAGHSLSVADVRADQSHDHLAVFHARVIEACRPGATRYVLCNLPDWEAMENRKVKWCWASAFSLRELEAFDRIELLGNRFRSDIGSEITQFFDSDAVEWEALPPLENARQFAHRPVYIHYFSDRPAAKSFFATQTGQSVLKEIGKHLAGALPRGNSIWSANDTAAFGDATPRSLLGLPGDDYLTPKQAGTNCYQAISHAAMIYAAKPSPNLRSLLSVMHIDADLWTRSVEHETILQFMTRTSVRDPANSTTVHLYVFDERQAGYLKNYFDALPHVIASISRVPLPLDIPPKSKGGRPAKSRTPQEQADWEAEKRRRDRDRKRRARAGNQRPGWPDRSYLVSKPLSGTLS